MNKKILPKIVHWSFAIFTIIYIFTGFGITSFQFITPMTFGLLSKSLSLQLHTFLIYPFIFLFLLHIFLSNHNKFWGIFFKK
jgi:cytochrome b subunit of formate dehydrogenase